MQQIYPDLWQSPAEQPIADVPDLITRAYLLTREDGNLLLYSTGFEDEHRHVEELGGLGRHLLSHADEAGPALQRIRSRFGSELWCHRLEADAVRQRGGVAPDGTFDGPETWSGTLEIIPSPGHTPGSTCFLYASPHDRTYLFTGDTIGRTDDGVWRNGFLPGMSNKATLIASLRMLAELQPDVVLSSAFGGQHAVNEVTSDEWRAAVDQALVPLIGNTRQ